jgi:hypothetical protein
MIRRTTKADDFLYPEGGDGMVAEIAPKRVAKVL